MLEFLIEWLLSIGMAVGPSAAYIPQYIEIHKTRNHKAFSSIICFILLTANISRLCCYIVEKYTYTLFVQSVLMVIVQLALLHLLVRLNTRDILPVTSKSSTDEERSVEAAAAVSDVSNRSYFGSFWEWSSFIEYLLFLAGFTAIFLGLIGVYIACHRPLFPGATFLYLSTGIESTLCMPQLLTNYRNKSTRGLNKTLVFTWITGDTYKLFYFLHSRSSNAFTLCTSIQLFVDCLIIVQIAYYNSSRNRTTPSSARDEDSVLTRPSSAIPLKGPENPKAPQIIVHNKL